MNNLVSLSGWLALFFGFAALFFYIVVPDQTILILSLTGVGLVNALFIMIVNRQAIRRGLKTRTALHGVNTVVLIVVFLGLLIFINLLSYRHKHRFDLTATGYFTLAPQTRKLVSNLPREVTITAFFQTDSPNKTQFKNLIDGYLGLTDKIKLAFVDPDKNPAIIKRYGVTTYGTIVLESGKKETKVQNPTEENLTNSILKVIKDEKKTVYFLEGHGERDLDKSEGEGYGNVKKSLERDGFKVEKLLLLKSGTVPKDADVVVMAGPKKPILVKEQKALGDYLAMGGSVFILVDPQSEFQMEDFLLKWGVVLKNDIVIDPLSKLFGGDYAAPVVNQYTFHDITKDFGLPTIYPVVRSVTARKVEGVETTELLQSGANSWGETDLNAEKVQYNEGIDEKGPVPLAVVVTREIESAGKKDKNGPTGSEKKIDAAEKKESGPKAHLIVIGDSDFASNNYVNFTGNGDFFLNIVSWLAEEENLISIRSRERKDTPIQLTREWGSTIFLMGTIVFPGCVVIVGLRKWWRRRRL
ncbi:MAG: GldG family protein [Nitrospinaceae bacterium]